MYGNFDHTELIGDGDKEPVYMARQHHDFQRIYRRLLLPGGEPRVDGGNTLLLTHKIFTSMKDFR